MYLFVWRWLEQEERALFSTRLYSTVIKSSACRNTMIKLGQNILTRYFRLNHVKFDSTRIFKVFTIQFKSRIFRSFSEKATKMCAIVLIVFKFTSKRQKSNFLGCLKIPVDSHPGIHTCLNMLETLQFVLYPQ